MRSEYNFGVPYAVALYGGRNGKAAYVSGARFDGARQCGMIAAEPLHSYAERVYGGKNVRFERRYRRIRMRLSAGTEQRAFGKHAGFIHRSAYAHSEQNGRAGVGTRFAYDADHRVDDALSAFGRGKHTHAAHIFASRAFGEKGNAELVAFYHVVIYDCRSIVPSIDAGERIGYRLARFGIPAPHAFFERRRKVAVERRFRTQSDEKHGYARILTRIAIGLSGYAVVFEYLIERPYRATVGFFRARPFEQSDSAFVDAFKRVIYRFCEFIGNFVAFIHKRIISQLFGKVNARRTIDKRRPRCYNMYMSLRICSVASGSKGNCIYISGRRTSLLLDMGVCMTRVRGALAEIGESMPKDIVLTHTHSDHYRYVGAAVKSGFTLHYNRVMRRFVGESEGAEEFCGDICIGDITVSPFAVSHDVPCFGYSFYSEGSKISVVTDLGFMPRPTLEAVSDSDAVLIESNYDEEMLRDNTEYPERLKARIAGARGHLSNTESAECVAYLVGKGVKNIILGHLSEQNNTPEKAVACVMDALSRHNLRGAANISVALQNTCSGVTEV